MGSRITFVPIKKKNTLCWDSLGHSGCELEDHSLRTIWRAEK